MEESSPRETEEEVREKLLQENQDSGTRIVQPITDLDPPQVINHFCLYSTLNEIFITRLHTTIEDNCSHFVIIELLTINIFFPSTFHYK